MNTELLTDSLSRADVPVEPDLLRKMSGFDVALTLLHEADVALIEVTCEQGKILLDSLVTSVGNGYDVYCHTALYSEALRNFLDRRPGLDEN